MNAASFGLGFVPSVAAQSTAMALNVSVKVGEEVQTRKRLLYPFPYYNPSTTKVLPNPKTHRTNSFLDQMNRQYFIPRGLFCLLMTYKPSQTSPLETLDITQTITKSLATPVSGLRGQLDTLKKSSGKTHSGFEIGEAAPLIFPALDAAPDAQKQNALKKGKNFVAEYYDRRAQATYVHFPSPWPFTC